MATSLINNVTFGGQSKYAADFQQILNRAVQIQALNLSNLQNSQATLQSKQAAVATLDQKFQLLQSTVDALGNSVGSSSFSASSSDASAASVTLSGASSPGIYQIKINSVGAQEQMLSSNGLTKVSDPSTQTLNGLTSFKLQVGAGAAKTITPRSASLQDLVNSINSDATLGVTASMVNVGSSSAPDYRLSLQSTKLGNIAISLSDPADSANTNLLDVAAAGSEASYTIAGHTVTSDTATVNLAPGVSVKLLQPTAANSSVTINVQQSTNSLQQTIQNFASAYNAVVDELAKSHGQNAGVLSGDSILSSARATLRSITGYTPSGGSITGMRDLGLSLDNAGHLNFEVSTFQATAASQGFTTVARFIGDSTQGFLYSATQAIQGLEAVGSGLLKNYQTTLTTSLTNLTKRINNEVDRINLFQDNLVQQLSKSDALIAQLQSQADFFKGLFTYKNNDN